MKDPRRAKTPKRSAPAAAPAPARRRRLSGEDAREAILVATEKRLREVGPDGLRLQEIARDVGLSHPTVLHHVGSREALVAAVVARSMLVLETELLEVIAKSFAPSEIAPTIEHVDGVMRGRGQARLIAWLALTLPADVRVRDSRLGDVARALQAAGEALGRTGTLEDTAFSVILTSTAMFGLALLGPRLFANLGLSESEAMQRRYRQWFADLLVEHAGLSKEDA